jgi:FAD/FMN-containing dehydrogenase/Fe-S oxidoreductase
MAGMSALAVRGLERALRSQIEGEVRFDAGSRALYATDASNYRQVPIGVVIPKSVEDVETTVRLCHAHDAPLLSRGGGTSLAGQCCNTAVIIDWSKYLNRVLSIDPDAREAWVEPGCVLDTLRDQAEQHQLTFGPDPSTHDHNTLGGMIGNNSCGVHSIMGGRTAENIEELEILTYDGVRMRVGRTSEEELEQIISAGGRRAEIYSTLKRLREHHADEIRRVYPSDLPRRVSGFNLDELLPERGFNLARALVGTEGTCVTVLKARVKLLPSPPVRVMVALGFPNIYLAADAVPRVMQHAPIGLEGLDDYLIELMRRQDLHPDKVALLPEGAGWLLAEFGGDGETEATAKAEELIRALETEDDPPAMKLIVEAPEQEKLWSVREAGLGATAHPPDEPHAWEGWEDAAVRPERLGDYLREFRRLLDRYGYKTSLYGHFGDGCIHCRIDFDLLSEKGIRAYRSFVQEAAELVLRHKGSLSGEHGDGQSRGELLSMMYGEKLVEAFREFKYIWDPRNRMNPGKVVDPAPLDSNLRLGADFQPAEPPTYFRFDQDGGSFARASLRCVGVGTCRHYTGGVMCPSYMVTRDEKHSTRGRARLLFEMVHGGTITDGWKSDAVHEALDLCLACKGCKSDCPVNVDMATYKAEFNAHYYAGRLRPRAAYSMGLIYWWSRFATRMPRVANAVTQTPGLSALAKRVGGIHPQRALPRYAPTSFRAWFAHRPPRRGGTPVILWTDTFYNHFYPEVARAAVEVLEAAGCKVLLPPRSLCCGRPLYAWGMLDTARGQLAQILDTLGPWVEYGLPIVGLEPSCTAALRDELPNLFPDDPRARRIQRQTHLLGDFLAERDFRPSPVRREAVVHVHCNQHAILGDEGDRELYRRLELDYRVLDSGCCGMAGSFGFETDHYELSVAAGERVLLPAVREAPPDQLVITNGFSCREQIGQGTGRRALHLAEVVRLGLHK